MRKTANLTAVLTTAGVLFFLAPTAPGQSTGSQGSSGSAQSGQSGTSSTDRDRPGQSGRMGSDNTSDTQSSSSSSSSSQSGSNQSSSGNLSSADKKFVMEAAQGGMAEVKLGQLATQKASSDQVKQFGQKMIDDHTKANDELKSLAERKGITLPTDMDSKDQSRYDRLNKLSGAEFDRAYMREMERDHGKDVAEFKRESQRGSDPELKDWASKTLSTLQEHDRMAHDTMAAVSGSGSGSRQGNTSTDRGDQPSTGDQNRSTSDRDRSTTDRDRSTSGDQSRNPR